MQSAKIETTPGQTSEETLRKHIRVAMNDQNCPIQIANSMIELERNADNPHVADFLKHVAYKKSMAELRKKTEALKKNPIK